MKKILALALLGMFLAGSSAFAGEWVGKITKKGTKTSFVSEGKTYAVANPSKAIGFVDKNVKITGDLNATTNSVQIKTIAAQ